MIPRLQDTRTPYRINSEKQSFLFGNVHDILKYMTIEFFTIGVSVRLPNRSLHRKEQNKFHQKLPPVGIETRTSGSSDQWLTN